MEKKYISALLSGLIFPGAGQLYNRQRVKGTVYIILTLVCIVALVFVIMRDVFHALEYTMASGGPPWDTMMRGLAASRTSILMWLMILAVSWAASVVDAYLVARDRDVPEIRRFISRKG